MKTRGKRILVDVGLTLAVLVLSTIVGGLFSQLDFHETNIVVVYIFSVLIVSRFTRGYLYGISASVISLLLFNWFFTEPYFTFKVNDMTYIITFAIMMLTSVLTSAITTKAKQSAEAAKKRENENKTLYQMTNCLTDAEDSESIAKIIVRTVGDALGCKTGFICLDANGSPQKTFIQRREDGTLIRRELKTSDPLYERVLNMGESAELTEDERLYPIRGKDGTLAVLVLPAEAEGEARSLLGMLNSVIESAALALERVKSLEEQIKSREETNRERYRGNLLRAISHDIRTPLSGIMGTGEMLLGATDKADPRYRLAEDILKDAGWLHDMVENILNLTRLQDGRLVLEKQPEAVEEVIGATLTAMEKRLPDRVIDITMPDNVVMAPMDARLISQVLINLLDNAHKHTPRDKQIAVKVSADEEQVCITVADRGTGILKEDMPHLFEMFYTTGGKSSDAKRGVGLGLAICQSIVEAHGGSITARNRTGGGAAFTFTLPIGGATL